VLTAERRCPTVQLGGRVRFIFILRPSIIQRPIPLPSTCIGPKSYLGLSSPTHYLSTTARALPPTLRSSECCTPISRLLAELVRPRPDVHGRQEWVATRQSTPVLSAWGGRRPRHVIGAAEMTATKRTFAPCDMLGPQGTRTWMRMETYPF
jgi:hypothetical protein